MNTTITLTNNNGTITATTTEGETFTAKEGTRFIQNLDKAMKAVNIHRYAYNLENGVMVAKAVILR